MKERTYRITAGGMFTAAGVLVPVLFHGLGLGPVFLPMFWPVAMCGFFLPPLHAAAVGLSVPLLSFFFTGMPPVPILYKMMVELLLLAVTVSTAAGYLKNRFLWPLAAGLLLSAAGGLAGAFLISLVLKIPPGLYAFSSIISSLPGIALMLGLIPLFMNRIKQYLPERR